MQITVEYRAELLFERAYAPSHEIDPAVGAEVDEAEFCYELIVQAETVCAVLGFGCLLRAIPTLYDRCFTTIIFADVVVCRTAAIE